MTDGPDDHHLWLDRDFRELARRLRKAAEDELAEVEHETERADNKRNDLTSRALRAIMEGEWWQVLAGGRTVEGLVVHSGLDFISLHDRAGHRHDIIHRAVSLIRLASVDHRDGTAVTARRPFTFRARLLDLELTGPVELSGTEPWSLIGTIDSINIDHLVLQEATGASVIVPLDAIGRVTRQPARDRRAGR